MHCYLTVVATCTFLSSVQIYTYICIYIYIYIYNFIYIYIHIYVYIYIYIYCIYYIIQFQYIDFSHWRFQFLNKLGMCHRMATLLSQQGVAMRKYATAATVRPFKFQDILEFEKAPEIPWRKLTSLLPICFVKHSVDSYRNPLNSVCIYYYGFSKGGAETPWI